jgi:hypothetical protein
MDNFLSNRDIYPALTFICLGIAAAATLIAYFWIQARREEVRALLKKDMLERGMTAEEIRTVMDAGEGAPRDRQSTVR